MAELDARGEIDRHAAMCLRQALHETRAGPIEMVLVDLRDLTAVDAAGLELLRGQAADCRAHGVALGLLVSGGERQSKLTEAFVLAGLGDTLHYASQSAVPAPRAPDRRRLRPRAMAARHLVPAASRSWPRRPRASRPT